MSVFAEPVAIETEALLARLTTAAYQVALRHGLKGSFLDLELELWRELRATLQSEGAASEELAWR